VALLTGSSQQHGFQLFGLMRKAGFRVSVGYQRQVLLVGKQEAGNAPIAGQVHQMPVVVDEEVVDADSFACAERGSRFKPCSRLASWFKPCSRLASVTLHS